MSVKVINLNTHCFFVLSGLSNPLGSCLGVEMCRRFKPGSVAVLIDTSQEKIQELKNEIKSLEHNIEVVCCVLEDWEHADTLRFQNLLQDVYGNDLISSNSFDLAFIIHNEGTGATSRLIEPQDAESWKSFVQENLYAPVALNVTFLQFAPLKDVPKLVVNIAPTLMVKPFTYSSLQGSCMKARHMYFRSMADYEVNNGISVISYLPGIFESHKPEYDLNENLIDLCDLEDYNEKWNKLPRVQPLQSTLKLINILEEISFLSGHDVDYYDNIVL